MASRHASQSTKDLATEGRVGKIQSTNKKLPLARVKKIAKMDEDVIAVSNAAALIISGATEKFAAYFAEQSFFFTLAEKKKGISYKHCASAVARLPQLDFLADVVPQRSANVDLKESKRPEARNRGDTSASIPAWARAHPEALAKIQAAQEQSLGRFDDQETRSPIPESQEVPQRTRHLSENETSTLRDSSEVTFGQPSEPVADLSGLDEDQSTLPLQHEDSEMNDT